MPYFPIPVHQSTTTPTTSTLDPKSTRGHMAVPTDDPFHDAWKIILAAKQLLTDAYNYDVYGRKVPTQTPPHDGSQRPSLSSSNDAPPTNQGRLHSLYNPDGRSSILNGKYKLGATDGK
jgi:hypothetical protein